ncbi:MAG: nucleotide exchange factor GrpE [Alphaproteobacteria bacterium]
MTDKPNDSETPEMPGAEYANPPGEDLGMVAENAEARIVALEGELAALKDQLLRSLAEAENQRRRAQRDRDEAVKYAAAQLGRDLLTVPDNLRRALEVAPPTDDERNAAFRIGVELVERDLLGVLEKHGIRRIVPMAERFDPNHHQAMFEVPTADHPPGTVVQVMQPGYIMGDRLLRPALVGVAKALPGEATAASVNTVV